MAGDEAAVSGRPSSYSPEIANRICARIAEGGSLRQICQSDDMPADSTVRKWVVDDQGGFSAQYARAREAQADYFAEEILEIADDGSNDWMERQNKDGSTYEVVNHDHISRSKLRVDSRKWLMSKVAPKRYGDKIEVEHSGAIQSMTDEMLDARIAQLLGKAGVGEALRGEGEAPAD